jgi:hypothetical protein
MKHPLFSMTTTPPPFSPPSHTAAPGSKWPKVLGIISIIFGAGSILQSIIGPVSMLLVKKQMQAFVDQGADQAKVDEYIAKITSHTYMSSVAVALLGIILLTGGILLLRRRRAASPILQVWAVLKIIVGGLIIFKSAALSRLQMEVMFSSTALGGGKEAEMVNTFASYGMWFSLIFGLVWLVILPVFILIWFNREKAKQEMNGW